MDRLIYQQYFTPAPWQQVLPELQRLYQSAQ
jgi:hypothetical protein